MVDKPKYKIYLQKNTEIPEDFKRFVYIPYMLCYAQRVTNDGISITMEVDNENILTHEVKTYTFTTSLDNVINTEIIDLKFPSSIHNRGPKRRYRRRTEISEDYDTYFEDDEDYDSLYDEEEA